MRTVTVLVFLILPLLTGCREKTEKQEAAYPIKIAQAVVQDVPCYIEGIGTFGCCSYAEIKAQTNGILTEVLFKDGKRVEKDDLLMTIDPRPFEAELKAAKADLIQNEARLAYALKLAKSYESLASKEYISKLSYEESVQNLKAIEAAIESDKARIESAEIKLDYCTIKAPFGGYVGMRSYDPGNLVVADGQSILVTLRKVSPLTLSFTIPSKYLYRVQQAQKKAPLIVEAILPYDPQQPLSGELNFIDNHICKATGMIRLQANLPNTDERGWPGQHVRVKLLLDTFPGKVLVPAKAVKLKENGHYVFVFDPETQKVEKRDVAAGLKKECLIAIDAGLKEGELVVTDGALNLSSGTKAFVVEDEEP